MTIVTLISAFFLFGFIGVSIRMHTLLPSYSAYASKWEIEKNLNLWQIVTFLSAMLLMPPMIESGQGNTLQFLGFATPAYLMAVGCTPNWESNKKEHIFHTAFAIICAICAFLWMALVAKVWFVIIPVAVIVAVLGYATSSIKSSITFWGEMVMFLSTYFTLLIR